MAITGMAPGMPSSGFRQAARSRCRRVRGPFRVRALSPTAPLGAFSLPSARASIRAALVRIAQDQVFDNWLMHRESSALSWTTCRRDWLPSMGTLELTSELPFLELATDAEAVEETRVLGVRVRGSPAFRDDPGGLLKGAGSGSNRVHGKDREVMTVVDSSQRVRGAAPCHPREMGPTPAGVLSTIDAPMTLSHSICPSCAESKPPADQPAPAG